jgi:hypothetical protein
MQFSLASGKLEFFVLEPIKKFLRVGVCSNCAFDYGSMNVKYESIDESRKSNVRDCSPLPLWATLTTN